MQQHAEEYVRQRIAIFAICPEPAPLAADFVRKNGISYAILSDAGGRLIRQVGILNSEVADTDPVNGIPYPGSYLVDEKGYIFEKRFHADFHVREPMGSLLLYFHLKEYSERLEEKVAERTLQLIETAKLATQGKLIAAITHELNTPLGALSSGKEILWRYVERALGGVPDRERAAVEEIRKTVDAACRRMIQVVNDLREFVRLEQSEVQAIDLRHSLDTVVEVLGSRLEQRIRIERDYSEIPALECRAPQINQALFEVIENAVEAIPGEGVIRLSARREDGDIVLAVSDSGRGIPAAEIEHIFEPHLRPKDGRVGVNLGLPLAHKILHEHGGRIQVESRGGAGATVTIRLPPASPG